MYQNRFRITELALQYGLPGMYANKEFAQAGGLMGVGANLADIRRRTLDYVDRILRGAQPSDLPVVRPDGYDFVINRKAAAALGIAFSATLSDLVTEWVD
jgi:putative ABC transport system substrate-binding protein